MKKAENCIKYNTIDIDSTSKEFFIMVLFKIIRKGLEERCLIKYFFKDSKRKGFHIQLYCNKNCDICRFVFDDDIRYAFDQYRENFSQNVLTQESEFLLIKKEDFLHGKEI